MPTLKTLARNRTWLIGAAVLVAVGLLYLTTLQTDINGLDDLVDAGEFQNALFLWGIVHPTGYPLYLMVGGAFVHLINLVGVNPAAGASLFSLLGALGALALLFAAVQFLTRRTLLAASLAFALAAVGAFWFRSIDAEVYTWAFFFVALALYLTLRFRAAPNPALLLAIAFALGTGAAHHRLVGLLGPAVLVYIWPEAYPLVRRNWRLAPLGLLALLAPFAVYLYLPLRSHWGTTWEFAQADTWSGFWSLFTGRGYLDAAIAIPSDPGALFSAVRDVAGLLAAQLSWPALGGALLALLTLLPGAQTRHLAAFLLVAIATYFGFAVIYPIRDIDAYLVPATMLLLFGAVVTLARWSVRWPRLPALGAAALFCLAAFLGAQAYPLAREVGTDQRGRELLDAVQPLSGAQTVLIGPWGPDFFVFWYGKYVTHEIAPQTQIVTPDAPIKRSLDSGLAAYASKDIFYSVPLDEWDQKLGHIFVQSAGDGIIQISDRPMDDPALESAAGEARFGILVTLVRSQTAFSPATRRLDLTLYWRAEQTPAYDYSVSVHLVDTGQNDRVIAQADSANPVYGFYPTSRWQAGEIVRDDYTLTVPPALPLTQVNLIVGWYRRDVATGAFQDLGTHRIPLPSTSRAGK
ncbi:MAG: DUF2723 domain-containing protein [Anaerolineae bacterium]